MLISLVRTVILYILILAALRLMGKRQIGDLQTSELVVTLLVSDIASLPMQDTSVPLASGLIPIFCLVSFELLLSFLMLKSGRIHRLICGKPVVIVSEGKLLQENLRLLRMTPEDLLEGLRQNGIASLEEVAWAIVETNGTLSILEKAQYRPLECGQIEKKLLQTPPEKTDPQFAVIRNGFFCDDSLSLCKKSRAWALQCLRREEILSEKDVFLMTASAGGEYTVVKKEHSK